MKGAQSISTRRAYGVQRICRVWGRARSSVYARRHATSAAGRRRRRQTLRHAVRQQGAGVVSGSPHRAAQHGVGRRENVFVAKPGARTGQQRGGSLEPQRLVFEEPRQPFTGGGIERARSRPSGWPSILSVRFSGSRWRTLKRSHGARRCYQRFAEAGRPSTQSRSCGTRIDTTSALQVFPVEILPITETISAPTALGSA